MSKIDGVKIHGVKTPDSHRFKSKLGVIVFEIKGMMSDRVARELAFFNGIGVRYGCHCAHIIIKYLLDVGPGLERFQRIIATLFRRINFPGLARVSLGIENSEEDIDLLIQALKDILKKQHKSPSNKQLTQLIDGFIQEQSARVYN
jgi:selenocysteine lyase/cysteine desulfurase